MALHVLRHVEANELDPHDVCQLLRRFRLADAGGAAEQERTDRLVCTAQSGPRHLDRGGQHLECLVLPENDTLQVAFDRLQLAAVVVADVGRGYARDLCDDVLDFGLGDGLLALARWQYALGRASFVDDIDRLVGQMTIVDVFGTQLGCCLQRRHCVLDAVVLLEARLQTLQDVDRFLHRRLNDVDLLEATRQGRVLLEDAAVFGKRRRPDALELTAGERRLQQIGCIQRTAGCSTRTDQRVDFVDKENCIRLVLQGLEHALQALLEIATILGTSE